MFDAIVCLSIPIASILTLTHAPAVYPQLGDVWCALPLPSPPVAGPCTEHNRTQSNLQTHTHTCAQCTPSLVMGGARCLCCPPVAGPCTKHNRTQSNLQIHTHTVYPELGDVWYASPRGYRSASYGGGETACSRDLIDWLICYTGYSRQRAAAINATPRDSRI